MLFINHCLLFRFREQIASDHRQQLLKNQPDSRVQRVITNYHSVTWAQENTSQNLFVTLFQIILRDRELWFHLSSSLLLQDSTKTSLTVAKKFLSLPNMFSFELNIDIPLHHPQHTLNPLNPTCTINFYRSCEYTASLLTICLNFWLTSYFSLSTYSYLTCILLILCRLVSADFSLYATTSTFSIWLFQLCWAARILYAVFIFLLQYTSLFKYQPLPQLWPQSYSPST